jgi:peptidoglycan/LPS O-acetylase OafA/YrhL
MPALDGFRAVAAFSVVLAHGLGISLFDGVTAFFVLSGFLITTLLLREHGSTGTVSLRAFYARRTLRIFPAYYACVIASFAIDYVAGQPWPASLTKSAFAYTVNYYNAFNGHPSTSIAHLWSLGVEEQFYLLWPAVFILLASLGLKRLRLALVVLLFAGVGWRSLLFYSGWVGQAYLYNAFDARFDDLAVGCLLATIARSPQAARFATVVGARVWMPLITIGLMTLLQVTLSGIPRHLFGFTLYSLLIGVLLVQLLELSRSWMWRWLDLAPVRFLGTISYPIYLYHAWGLGLGLWLTPLSHTGQFIAGVIFTVIGATGSYFVVERPCNALKRHFGPGAKAGKAATPATRVAPVCVGQFGQ